MSKSFILEPKSTQRTEGTTEDLFITIQEQNEIKLTFESKIESNYEIDLIFSNIVNKSETISFLYSNKDSKNPLSLGEFTAVYYRLIDEQCYLVAYNKLNQKSGFNNAWLNGHNFRMVNLHNNQLMVFDEMYVLGINNILIDRVRTKYKFNLIEQEDIEDHHAYGVSDAVTSLAQSIDILRRYSTRLFSTNLSILFFQKNQVYLKSILDKTIGFLPKQNEIEQFVIKNIIQLINQQEIEIENSQICQDYGIYSIGNHYLFLQALHYFGQYESIIASIQELAITSLSVLFLGVEESNPNLYEIDFFELFEIVANDAEIEQSFIRSCVKAHRQHYPSRFITTL